MPPKAAKAHEVPADAKKTWLCDSHGPSWKAVLPSASGAQGRALDEYLRGGRAGTHSQREHSWPFQGHRCFYERGWFFTLHSVPHVPASWAFALDGGQGPGRSSPHRLGRTAQEVSKLMQHLLPATWAHVLAAALRLPSLPLPACQSETPPYRSLVSLSWNPFSLCIQGCPPGKDEWEKLPMLFVPRVCATSSTASWMPSSLPSEEVKVGPRGPQVFFGFFYWWTFVEKPVP